MSENNASGEILEERVIEEDFPIIPGWMRGVANIGLTGVQLSYFAIASMFAENSLSLDHSELLAATFPVYFSGVIAGGFVIREIYVRALATGCRIVYHD